MRSHERPSFYLESQLKFWGGDVTLTQNFMNIKGHGIMARSANYFKINSILAKLFLSWTNRLDKKKLHYKMFCKSDILSQFINRV